MRLIVALLFSFLGSTLAALNQTVTTTSSSPTTIACHADNCARAVTGTRLGSTQLAQATLDCRSFLRETVTEPPFTVTVTATMANTITISKRAPAPTSSGWVIPDYASACTDAARYASACTCLGLTADTTTIKATWTTVTVTALSTATVIHSSASATASCQAINTLTDPNNCGKLNNVCQSGVCENGSCTSASCTGETCAGGFTNCNPSNTNCFCFTNAKGAGFCGSNAPCAGLTPCITDVDCNVPGSTGNICAVNTCCATSGVCLSGQCANPSTRLLRMAREVARSNLGAGTAAFLWA